MTRGTSSMAALLSMMPTQLMLPCMDGVDDCAVRGVIGDTYTHINDGAVTDVGLEHPVSGDSRHESRDDILLMRVSNIMRSTSARSS